MSVVPLTLTISLCLVFTFVIFFMREHARSGVSSAERDSLLPLTDETPRLAGRRADEPAAQHDDFEDHAGCVGRDGRRALCAGCLKHAGDHAPTR
ncbi:MAG: hypothetical protein H7343_05715 [Undibacterium sp.]|nr:hypothetical protein [Opitutaceae bacterium]